MTQQCSALSCRWRPWACAPATCVRECEGCCLREGPCAGLPLGSFYLPGPPLISFPQPASFLEMDLFFSLSTMEDVFSPKSHIHFFRSRSSFLLAWIRATPVTSFLFLPLRWQVVPFPFPLCSQVWQRAIWLHYRALLVSLSSPTPLPASPLCHLWG